MIKKTFSKEFSITPTDFLDVNLYGDNRYFIDPTKLKAATSTRFNGDAIMANIEAFMRKNYQRLDNAAGSKKLHQSLATPHELNFTRLGYSSNQPQGTGTSDPMLTQLLTRVKACHIDQDLLNKRPQLLALLAKDFGFDRLSDLITNLGVLELADYTQLICDENNIPLSTATTLTYYDIASDTWQKTIRVLPLDKNKKPILLCPKTILVPQYDFSVGNFIWKIVLTARQNELFEQGIKLSKKKILQRDLAKVPNQSSKAYALEQISQHPHFLEDYLKYMTY